MRRFRFYFAVALLAASTVGSAAVFRFDTDPFAGSTALTTPGRQVVGLESFIDFSTGTDLFSLESTVFGVQGPVAFANDLATNLPPAGVNVIVLRTFDNDNDPASPFGAGNAANLIAAQITSPGPGFFIYFNSVLGVPRLVYSTDLSENTADLKILFRMTNLTGQGGQDAMQTFTAANFEITTVPEPATVLLTAGAGVFIAGLRRWRGTRG